MEEEEDVVIIGIVGGGTGIQQPPEEGPILANIGGFEHSTSFSKDI